MVITQDTVKHLAWLARIKLDQEEMEYFAKQLDRVLEYIDKLKKIDISKIEPTSHVLSLKNIFREDKIGKSSSSNEVLTNAPSVDNNFFKVPRIIQ